MINPQFEVDRLKQTLIFKGLSNTEAQEIGNLAMQDIDVAINSLTAEAMNKAAEAGMSMGAEEFVEQIQAVSSGGIFRISTSSGKTDFSLPPFPMLPKLLKNAKVAKDGSLYKVIPIGSKGPKTRKNVTTLFDVQQDINKQHIADQEQRKQTLQEARELTLTNGGGSFSGLHKARQLLAKKRQETERQEAPKSKHTVFRTASSKQNPSQSWVLPKKDLNMKFILDEINRRLELDIQSAVNDIVRSYEELI